MITVLIEVYRTGWDHDPIHTERYDDVPEAFVEGVMEGFRKSYPKALVTKIIIG